MVIIKWISIDNIRLGYVPTYTVKVVSNILGDPVFSIQKPDETVYYVQPDISSIRQKSKIPTKVESPY